MLPTRLHWLAFFPCPRSVSYIYPDVLAAHDQRCDVGEVHHFAVEEDEVIPLFRYRVNQAFLDLSALAVPVNLGNGRSDSSQSPMKESPINFYNGTAHP
jgi:hypothetical protein